MGALKFFPLDDSFDGMKQSMPVGYNCIFLDQVWDFYNPTIERQISLDPYRYRIHWDKFSDSIPVQILESIKVLAYLMSHDIMINTNTDLNIQPVKAPSICKKVTNLLILFKIICDDHVVNDQCVLKTIFEIEPLDIQNGLDKYTTVSVDGLRQLLRALAEDLVVNNFIELTACEGTLKWNSTDVRNMNFPVRGLTDKTEIRTMILPDELLIFLIKTATVDVVSLLRRLDLSLNENYKVESDTFRFPKSLDVHQVVSAYKDISKNENKSGNRIVDRNARQRFKRDFGISIISFRNELLRIQSAARYLVIQFTGVRYSEAISFKNGALEQKENAHYIKGTVIKGRSERLITGTDYWIAIPIVRDAIQVLEFVTSITLHDKLFARNCFAHSGPKFNSVLSNKGLNHNLNRYLVDVDVDKKFSEKNTENLVARRFEIVKPKYLVTIHRLRHTLAYQFHKHRAGLEVISFHFKHAYFATLLYKIPNEVTAGYGNISNEIFKSASHIEIVKEEMVNSIYSPEAPIAGGGAAEFLQRRKDFFAGEIAKGKTRKEILRDLAQRRLPYADVGLGFCGGKKNVLNDTGVEEPPPCIGQLKCNPNNCKNAIIPDIKLPHWKALLKHNTELLKDKRFEHAHETAALVVDEASMVISNLHETK